MQKIHKSATTTVVSAPSGTQPSGPVTFTALVVGHDGGTPTGMVTFQEGARVLAQAALTRERTARFTLSDLGAPTRTITAVYASDPLFAASSGNVSFPDTTPPGMPTGLSAKSGPDSRQVTLAWQPNPSSAGSVVYEIWRDPPLSGSATQIGTAVAPFFVDTRTRSGRISRYFLVAVDGTGNRSPRSALVWGQSK
ncbi:MAG TPA: Ig-like domain-containing protein [Vicinamibacterales bacterium]|nr:Ig-like domain-containing protein [Vicinamibacterales bacterium]